MEKLSKTMNAGSRYWLGDVFDSGYRRDDGKADLAKLAAAQRAIGNFVNIVTGKQIPVVFQTSNDSYTDGKRVVIGTSLNEKNFDPAVGLALHEGSHILLTDFTLLRQPDGSSTTHMEYTLLAQLARTRVPDARRRDFEIIKDLLNWIEDRRIDYHVYTNAPGYRLYYESMYQKYFNNRIIDKALECNVKKTETWDDYLFHIINFTNPKRKLDTLKQLRTIWNVIDLKNINRLKSTRDVLEVAITVYTIIAEAVLSAKETVSVSSIESKNNNNDSDLAEDNNSSASGSIGTDTSNETEDNDDSDETEDNVELDNDDSDETDELDNDDSDESIDSPTDPSLTDKELEKLEDAIADQKNFIGNNIKKVGKLSKAAAGIVNAFRESGTEIRTVYTTQSGTGCPIETVVIKKLTNSIICSMPELFTYNAREYINGSLDYIEDVCNNSKRSRYIKQTEDAVVSGIILGKQLGKKLQIRDAERTLKTTRLETGKIDKRLISQLGYGNMQVFHRIVTDRFKNYFIHISIDASGSMAGGNKFHNALKSAVAIAQAASMTTGIRVQISLRGTAHLAHIEKCLTIYAYDSAVDKMSKIRTMFKYLSTYGCTPEGIAFKSISSDIKHDARGDECIFINYSDGFPTDPAGVAKDYNGIEFTRICINSFREMNINVISYFINNNNTTYVSARDRMAFTRMYGPDAQYINPINMSDISKTINGKFLEISK